jgi:hypothetical protein
VFLPWFSGKENKVLEFFMELLWLPAGKGGYVVHSSVPNLL